MYFNSLRCKPPQYGCKIRDVLEIPHAWLKWHNFKIGSVSSVFLFCSNYCKEFESSESSQLIITQFSVSFLIIYYLSFTSEKKFLRLGILNIKPDICLTRKFIFHFHFRPFISKYTNKLCINTRTYCDTWRKCSIMTAIFNHCNVTVFLFYLRFHVLRTWCKCRCDDCNTFFTLFKKKRWRRSVNISLDKYKHEWFSFM